MVDVCENGITKTYYIPGENKWAEYANFHLHCHQHAVRIDHRSYEEQGIDLKPGIHQGKAAQEKARRGENMDRIEEANTIRRLNLARLSENAEIVFHSIRMIRLQIHKLLKYWHVM